MTGTWRRYRSFDRTARLLMVNQFGINAGFYMLMPYLAAHLTGDLALSAAVAGLVLGVRNLSQQGMFLIGGTLADRYGHRNMIIAGCGLRTAGFALFALAGTVPALLAAAAATGLAGALFNPAVRALLAASAPDRRVEAFAIFNVFYQTGILAGPLIGVALTGIDFRLTCAVAAIVFAVLTLAQLTALPRDPAPTAVRQAQSTLHEWRLVFANRRFLAFSAAMLGSYVLSFQVYLALPLQIHDSIDDPRTATLATGILFAVSAIVAITAQLRLTDWCRRTWTPGRCLSAGLALMTAAYLPATVLTGAPATARLAGTLAAAALLALGSAMAYPFEMDTIVGLARDRLVATHYGLYQTIAGIGILAANTGIGELLTDTASARPWLALVLIGGCATLSVSVLSRTGRLTPTPLPVTQAVPGGGPDSVSAEHATVG